MYETPAGRAVRENLKRMAFGSPAESTAAHDELPARLRVAVEELKELGWPIERIVIRLKEVADEVGFPPRYSVVGRNREDIVADIIRCCIDQYYGR